MRTAYSIFGDIMTNEQFNTAFTEFLDKSEISPEEFFSLMAKSYHFQKEKESDNLMKSILQSLAEQMEIASINEYALTK